MREAREYSECSWGAITVTKCLEWSWSIRDHVLVMLTLLALLKLVPTTQCYIPLLTSGGAATVMNKESDAMMEKKPCSSTVMLGNILRMLLLRLCFCRCPALAAGEDIRFFLAKESLFFVRFVFTPPQTNQNFRASKLEFNQTANAASVSWENLKFHWSVAFLDNHSSYMTDFWKKVLTN